MNLVDEIKKWAIDNYENGGFWIIETFTDEEIAQEFASLDDAKRYCRLTDDREKECQGW